MKTAFFTKYHEDGASSRCRSYQYAPYFKEAGHEIAFFPLMYEGYINDLYSGRQRPLKKLSCVIRRMLAVFYARKKFDLLVIEKELVHGLPFVFERMLLGSCSYTLDFDDAHFLRYRARPVQKWLLGKKIDKLSGRARLTTVGNRWYYERITKGTQAYLPTVVDTAHYPDENPKKAKDEVLRIVWIGTPGTLKYLRTLVPLLAELNRTRPFVLRVIGAELHPEGLDVECLPWSAETEADLLVRSDIGIMPLADSAWEDGKCGYKLIQYMAAGLPTTASPAAANREITIQGETGFLASNEAEWRTSLKELLDDPSLRSRMGSAGRERIRTHYALGVWGPRYVSLLENAVAASRKTKPPFKGIASKGGKDDSL